MSTLGIYEAKTKFSEICERVAETGEPVVVTKRGVPLVQIYPVGPQDGAVSTVWGSRERFVDEHGDFEDDLDLPPRVVEEYKSPF